MQVPLHCARTSSAPVQAPWCVSLPGRVIYLYGVVVLLMALIHLSSPDYRYNGFPSECPPDKQWGCRQARGAGAAAAWDIRQRAARAVATQQPLPPRTPARALAAA